MSPKKSTAPKKSSTKAGARSATARKVAKSKRATQAAQKASEQSVTKPDEMASDVLEFVQAIDDYKRINGRPFPNWSEVLEVLKGLGYERS